MALVNCYKFHSSNLLLICSNFATLIFYDQIDVLTQRNVHHNIAYLPMNYIVCSFSTIVLTLGIVPQLFVVSTVVLFGGFVDHIGCNKLHRKHTV
jgi:hypothetical protein